VISFRTFGSFSSHEDVVEEDAHRNMIGGHHSRKKAKVQKSSPAKERAAKHHWEHESIKQPKEYLRCTNACEDCEAKILSRDDKVRRDDEQVDEERQPEPKIP